MDQRRFSLLSRLWLKEVDEATLAEIEALPGLASQASSQEELAVAYADAFLLNGYPYASVFLDLNAEMNGKRAREFLALYQQYGYEPESLSEVGAPDHMGLALGLLAHIPPPQRASVLSKYFLDWAPVMGFSIERQPEVHPFYRALAVLTRQELFRAFEGEDLIANPPAASQTSSEDWIDLPLYEPGEEMSLSQVVGYLLCPARSGIFLSRAQLGQWALKMGVPLAFGERYRLGISLFEAAGIADRVPELLGLLLSELDTWDAAYVGWAKECQIWALFAGEWRERIASARTLFEYARLTLQAAPL